MQQSPEYVFIKDALIECYIDFDNLLFELHHEETCFWRICENKGTDQLCGDSAADQRLLFLLHIYIYI